MAVSHIKRDQYRAASSKMARTPFENEMRREAEI
jgi:hypothetical protein